MNDAMIRRHLSGTRLLLLDMIGAGSALDREQLLSLWRKRRPAVPERAAVRVPRMVDQLLWEVENLEWVKRVAGGYILTELGERARSLSHADR
jgi:hypothetical protein